MFAYVAQKLNVATIVAFFVPPLVALPLSSCFQKQPSHPVLAKITRIRAEGAKLPMTVIIMETADGLTGEYRIPTSELTCHLGQTVHAVKTGVSLALRAGECGTYLQN